MTNLKFKLLETVIIDLNGHPVKINKSDFNPKIHKMFGEKEEVVVLKSKVVENQIPKAKSKPVKK